MIIATAGSLTAVLYSTMKKYEYQTIPLFFSHITTLIKSKQHVTVPSTVLMLELGWARGQSSSFLRQLCSMYSGQTSNFNQEGSRETFPLELFAGEDGLAGFASEELLIHILTTQIDASKD